MVELIYKLVGGIMAKKKFDLGLFIITLFLGWFGIDKLVKGSGKLCIIKLLLNFLIIGEIWNIYDLICICIGKYKLNPLK